MYSNTCQECCLHHWYKYWCRCTGKLAGCVVTNHFTVSGLCEGGEFLSLPFFIVATIFPTVYYVHRGLYCTVTTTDKFHCTLHIWSQETCDCIIQRPLWVGFTVHLVFGPRRQVAALNSDLYRQVSLYIVHLVQRRLAVLDRWLH